jgi:hypothetical protein
MKGFGGMNMNKLMEEAQKLQEKMLKIQSELANKTVEATVGGGMVTVTANGQGDFVSVKIDPQVINPEDAEMLEDLILSAFNEAKKRAQELTNAEMSKVTGGLKVPGMSGMMGM